MNKKMIIFLTSLFVALPITALFILMIGNITTDGHDGISIQYFITEATHAGRSGGIAPILLSTTIIVFLTLLFSTPFSFCCALVLTLVIPKNRFLLSLFEISLSILSGLPSVVFGLFGSSFFGKTLGFGYSLLSGALTLSCMALPFYTKILHDNFKIMPREYFLSGKALNLSLYQFSKNILIPLNRYAIASGAIFSISRALGETAALIFTSGYVDRYPHSLLDSGRTLSVHIYDLSLNVPGGDQAALKASFVFLVLSLVINFILSVVIKETTHRGLK
ncbi:MAG: PstA family ABC transporter permease [Bacteriovorax sp.]